MCNLRKNESWCLVRNHVIGKFLYDFNSSVFLQIGMSFFLNLERISEVVS